MGSNNSKPTDVSDAAWERHQDKKLAILNEEIKENARLQKETNDKMTTFNANLFEYYSACHDTPQVMMMFPSYRNRCSLARGILIHDVTGMLMTSNNLENGKQMIEKINKM